MKKIMRRLTYLYINIEFISETKFGDTIICNFLDEKNYEVVPAMDLDQIF